MPYSFKKTFTREGNTKAIYTKYKELIYSVPFYNKNDTTYMYAHSHVHLDYLLVGSFVHTVTHLSFCTYSNTSILLYIQ